MFIQIGLGVLVLASFVIAYLSARTWHWGHVLVVLGIFLSTVGFFILSAEVLRINAVLRKQVNAKEKELTAVTARNEALLRGSKDAGVINQLRGAEVKIPEDAESIPSIAELDHELKLQTQVRGRVWRKVANGGFDPKSGTLKIAVESPTPAGINAESVVYLFEEGNPALPDPTKGAQFLGEFRVTEATGQQATLQPLLELDEFAARRLAGSRGPWAMYETMPADRYEIFAGLTEEQLKQILPPQSVNEYIRHGKDAGPDDSEWQKVGFDENGKRLDPKDIGKAAKVLYQRRLRDYALDFEELARQRAALLADASGIKQDNQRLAAALASAKELQKFREDEIAKLKTDLAGVTKEREAIEKHQKLVQQQLANAEKLLAETLQKNSQLAKELAARQMRSGRLPSGATSPAAPGPLALGVAK